MKSPECATGKDIFSVVPEFSQKRKRKEEGEKLEEGKKISMICSI